MGNEGGAAVAGQWGVGSKGGAAVAAQWRCARVVEMRIDATMGMEGRNVLNAIQSGLGDCLMMPEDAAAYTSSTDAENEFGVVQ